MTMTLRANEAWIYDICQFKNYLSNMAMVLALIIDILISPKFLDPLEFTATNNTSV